MFDQVTVGDQQTRPHSEQMQGQRRGSQILKYRGTRKVIIIIIAEKICCSSLIVEWVTFSVSSIRSVESDLGLICWLGDSHMEAIFIRVFFLAVEDVEHLNLERLSMKSCCTRRLAKLVCHRPKSQ